MRSRNKTKKKDVNKILHTTLRSDMSGQMCPDATTEIQLELYFKPLLSHRCCVQFAIPKLSVVCFLFLLVLNIIRLKHLGKFMELFLL